MNVSELILYKKNLILETWVSEVRKEVPESNHYQKLAIENDIPILLEELAKSLENENLKPAKHESKEHGELRALFEQYSLSHVIREYRLLLQVLFQFIDEEINIRSDERNKIIFGINYAIEHASESFFQMRQKEQQEEYVHAETLIDTLKEEGTLRDKFIGTLTHDLRNPLATTHSLISLLRHKSDDPELENILMAMQLSLKQADRLIRNLQDVNLIKSGEKMPLQPSPCDLAGEVRAAVMAAQQQYTGQISLLNEGAALTGTYDCGIIRRALDNLIQNAMKYGDHNSTITVTCKKALKDAVIISVHNYGNPISEEDQGKIFSQYYRTMSVEASPGWGLGLALVKGIAEAHGGSISVSSNSESGTTFYLTIREAPNSQE